MPERGLGDFYLCEVCGIDPSNMKENGCQRPASSVAGPDAASRPLLFKTRGIFLISASHLEASACTNL